MPSWFVHMNVAKKAINDLPGNPRVASILGAGGPSANDIASIAASNPSYVALGSIGPDLFVFLPDFKPPLGPPIYEIMKFMEGFWEKIDPYIAAYEQSLGPQVDQAGSIANALTGGLLQTITDASQQISNILITALEDLVTSQFDWFSILGSGVPSGYDEQTFFWSDMLHYRKTYEFGARLWRNAQTDQERAYAIGWMTHLGTDVVGHSFVNQKCGGPFRLHWQRHHLIENHMDAYVYGRDFGNQPMYQSLCGAAQHLWIAFDDDGTPLPPSHVTPPSNLLSSGSGLATSFFQPQDRPTFDPTDKQATRAAWDVDSDLPEGIKDLLIKTLMDVYPDLPPSHHTAGLMEQCADHPAILNNGGYPKQNDDETTDFYVTTIPNHGDMETAYFYLYKYVKMTTTNYYKMQPPGAPPVFPWPTFPSPPGSPGGNGSGDPGLDFWDILLDIFSWILFIAECIALVPALLAAATLGPLTYPFREAVYQFIELPLYNAWLSFHWILSITGYAIPLPGEITPALHTLGVGFDDNWNLLQAELSDLSGGLLGTVPALHSEPSGVDRDKAYPRDVVSDPKSSIPTIPSQIMALFDNSEGVSEFTRPWRWPQVDNEGDNVPTELPSIARAGSPYHSGLDAFVLMADDPGNQQFRTAVEGAGSAAATVDIVSSGLQAGEHLGDPGDYSAYVIAKLTRDDPNPIVNFNLDADRGYCFLCWDWLRMPEVNAAPNAYSNKLPFQQINAPLNSTHQYQAPRQAGSGWDQWDILVNQPAPQPVQHNPYEQNNPPVVVRYIDREEKY